MQWLESVEEAVELIGDVLFESKATPIVRWTLLKAAARVGYRRLGIKTWMKRCHRRLCGLEWGLIRYSEEQQC